MKSAAPSLTADEQSYAVKTWRYLRLAIIGLVIAEAIYRARQDAGYATQFQLIESYWSRDKHAKTAGVGR